MARVHHTRPLQQQGASRAMALDKTRAAVKKKKPYKIVLEAVTQEKKKLHSIVRSLQSYHAFATNYHLADIRLKCAPGLWFRSSRTPRDN
jgi:hypothetical protein